MDKIDKFLNKLGTQESKRAMTVIEHILSRNFAEYDIKKLQGYRDVYRIRVGTIRIIFRQDTDDVRLLDISRRSEKTYKDF